MNNRFTNQRASPSKGFSMVSLMIGSLIGVLVMVVGLNFYKSQVQLSTTMRLSTDHNGQLAFFLTTLEMQLTRAGFGILRVDPTNEPRDFVIAQTSISNNIFWRFKESQVRCLGVQESHAEAPNGQTTVSLFLVQPTGSCGLTDDLDRLQWKPVERIAKFRSPKLQAYLADEDWLLDFASEEVYCAPFGLNADTKFKRIRLALSVPSYGVLADDIDRSGGTIGINTCLNNVRIKQDT